MSVRFPKDPNVNRYKFFVKHTNRCDESRSNDEIKTVSFPPDKMEQPRISEVGCSVKLTWDVPRENGSSISHYVVEFRD